jgi:hypothetical protein
VPVGHESAAMKELGMNLPGVEDAQTPVPKGLEEPEAQAVGVPAAVAHAEPAGHGKHSIWLDKG